MTLLSSSKIHYSSDGKFTIKFGKRRKLLLRERPKSNVSQVVCLIFRATTYSAIRKMRQENEVASSTNIVASITERSRTVVEDTRETITIVRITKDNGSANPVLDRRRELICCKVRNLRTLTTKASVKLVIIQ